MVLRRSYQAHTVTVELRFYNIITTINTIFLESLSDESGIRTHADCSTRLGGLVGFDGIVRDREGEVERSGSPCFWVRGRVVGATLAHWVVLRRSDLAHTGTVELRFYNIITTINTIFLESVSFFITKV